MKKIAHYEFEAPKIIGILSDRTVPSTIQRKFDQVLKRKKLPFVCLPFRVETKHLKNVTACMRLMDIEGIIILGGHERRIKKFVASMDPLSKEAGKVNLLKKKRNKFNGYYIEKTRNFYQTAVKLLTSR
jgi:shikimate 5-dehydrogenase